ncbi:unnamed protein product [Adineta steineri]|uniref:Uncharacterized protein n=2 Tax=Adineta steineri TaxID=433720 RepID=A0A814PTW4_9BILA|nr:unnamed protein product [Adineta steineri]
MEDSIYRMSLVEGFLVLIVIGLWFIAIINLVRKLERICNPPSIYLNYSTQNNLSLRLSTDHEHYRNNFIKPITTSRIHFIRAISEPTIDASPRTTIHVRSPSETFAQSKASISQQMSSRSTIEIEASTSSINLSHQNNYRNHVETISNKLISSEKLSYPKRLPSIVKRSLLNLHRRTLFPNTTLTRCTIVTTDVPTKFKFPIMDKQLPKTDEISEHDC